MKGLLAWMGACLCQLEDPALRRLQPARSRAGDVPGQPAVRPAVLDRDRLGIVGGRHAAGGDRRDGRAAGGHADGDVAADRCGGDRRRPVRLQRLPGRPRAAHVPRDLAAAVGVCRPWRRRVGRGHACDRQYAQDLECPRPHGALRARRLADAGGDQRLRRVRRQRPAAQQPDHADRSGRRKPDEFRRLHAGDLQEHLAGLPQGQRPVGPVADRRPGGEFGCVRGIRPGRRAGRGDHRASARRRRASSSPAACWASARCLRRSRSARSSTSRARGS